MTSLTGSGMGMIPVDGGVLFRVEIAELPDTKYVEMLADYETVAEIIKILSEMTGDSDA